MNMKCSVCFFCEEKQEFHFCKCHRLEVFNPESAGCNDGRRSLTIVVDNIKERIIEQTEQSRISYTHHPSRLSALASWV
jgi:hypothetical protein